MCRAADRLGRPRATVEGCRGDGGFTPREKTERPADKAVRRANLRRIGRLFRPYWAKLSIVTVLILVASALGVIPAFLLRAVIDTFVRRVEAACHVRLPPAHACSSAG